MTECRRKTEFRYFSIAQWRQEQTYLQEEHKKGWKFRYVTLPGFYHFDKCEPEDVIYQLDYNVAGGEQQPEYLQMFRDCGWEYMQDLCGYSYFRKPVSEMNGEEEIFCDDESRLDMMKRVFKGRCIPLLVIFFCIIIPQLFFHSHYQNPLSPLFIVCFGILFFAYLSIFLWFGWHYWKYRKSL